MSEEPFEVVDVAAVRRRKSRAPRSSAVDPAASVDSAAVVAAVPVTVMYVARKTLRLNGKLIRPGTLVPEASTWPRVESWVRSGYLDVAEV